MDLSEHPLRRDLVREMHLRRFAQVTAAARIIQTVSLVDEEDRAAEFERLSQIAVPRGVELYSEARHAAIALDDGTAFLWERHTEATTLTVIAGPGSGDEMSKASALLEDFPGLVIRATRIVVEADEKAAVKRLGEMGFEEGELVCCEINAGVTIWSDFRIREDGFGRLLLTAGEAGPTELGRIIQRIQELGNYRNMALLGLPEVRRLTPALTDLESRLARYSQELGEEEGESDEELMRNLSALSAELARLRVESSYRLSASRAYSQIAMDRLAALSISPRDGYQDLAEFTERRLVPGMRTCETFVDRLRRLSERTGEAIALLNTRIDTRIKAQNLDLLRSMEGSFALQPRLQNLVEALSVVAATYYTVGLIEYLIKGAKAFPGGDQLDIALAIVSPVVMLAILSAMSRMRHRVIRETEIALDSFEKGGAAGNQNQIEDLRRRKTVFSGLGERKMNTSRILTGGLATASLFALAACGSRADEEAAAPAATATEEPAAAETETAPAAAMEPEVEPNGTVIEVQMLTRDPDGGGMQAFKPRLITAKVGDTIKFIPTDPTHQSSSIDGMVPEGARGWEGAINKEVSYVVPKPGIYGFKCVPHLAAGMVGLVVVEGDGKTANLEAAKAVSHPGLAKGKFEEIFAEAEAQGLLGS